MVRIITRRSTQLQKRNRIQLFNLKQLINNNKSTNNKSTNNKSISPKVLKSKQPITKSMSSVKYTTAAAVTAIKSRSSTTTTTAAHTPHTKITIITRSNKLNQFLNNYNIIIKKEPQDNIINLQPQQQSQHIITNNNNNNNNNIITKIPIITRSSIKNNIEYIKNYNNLLNNK